MLCLRELKLNRSTFGCRACATFQKTVCDSKVMNFTEFRRTLDGIIEIFGTNEFYNCTSEVESKVTVIEADVATDAQHC